MQPIDDHIRAVVSGRPVVLLESYSVDDQLRALDLAHATRIMVIGTRAGGAGKGLVRERFGLPSHMSVTQLAIEPSPMDGSGWIDLAARPDVRRALDDFDPGRSAVVCAATLRPVLHADTHAGRELLCAQRPAWLEYEIKDVAQSNSSSSAPGTPQ